MNPTSKLRAVINKLTPFCYNRYMSKPQNKKDSSENETFLYVGITFMSTAVVFMINDATRAVGLPFLVIGITFIIIGFDAKKKTKK